VAKNLTERAEFRVAVWQLCCIPVLFRLAKIFVGKLSGGGILAGAFENGLLAEEK
jgi:hypothetical protein